MQRIYSEVPRYLEGETVIVIGGGPSLVDFDFDTLEGFNMIGANDAGLLTKAQTIITLDRNYYRNRLKEMVKKAREGRMVYAALPTDLPPDTKFPDEIVHLQFKRGRGLAQNPEMIYGLNSGFAALNVAYLSGAKDIRLIGFDFKFNPDQPHWHKEYSWFTQKNDRQIQRWAKDFELTLPQLEAAGARVTNYVGPEGSAITAYKTRPLGDVAK